MKKPMTIVIVVLLVALLGVTVGSAWIIVSSINKRGADTAEAVTDKPHRTLTPAQIDLFTLSDAISTNLANEGSAGHAIRISVAIGVDNTDKKGSPALMTLMNDKESIIRDTIISIVGQTTYSQATDAEAKTALGDAILSKLREIFQSDLLVSVYFDEFYVL